MGEDKELENTPMSHHDSLVVVMVVVNRSTALNFNKYEDWFSPQLQPKRAKDQDQTRLLSTTSL